MVRIECRQGDRPHPSSCSVSQDPETTGAKACREARVCKLGSMGRAHGREAPVRPWAEVRGEQVPVEVMGRGQGDRPQQKSWAEVREVG